VKLSSAVSEIGNRFGARPFLMSLVALYAAIWIWAAWAPVYRFDWFLENILTTLALLVLIVSFRRLPLSDITYLLLFLFLVMHAVGGHYTYSEVPLGFWLQEALGLARNHFDRLVHFCFGFLLFYPMREVIIRIVTHNSFHAGLFAVSLNAMASGLFEIIEMVIAIIVNPEAGIAYLGTQGDEWDAQKDMALAFGGSLIALFLTELAVRTGVLNSYLVPARR
jgi:putative membrane protein